MSYSKVIENFLRYIKIDTQSLEEYSDKVPSTDKQRDLAKLLYQELTELGASDVRYDEEHSYVYAVIPSNIRGGTDGARLSFDGLLCPNICTGSEGHHGRNEFACIEDMEKIVEILLNLVDLYA